MMAPIETVMTTRLTVWYFSADSSMLTVPLTAGPITSNNDVAQTTITRKLHCPLPSGTMPAAEVSSLLGLMVKHSRSLRTLGDSVCMIMSIPRTASSKAPS